MSHTVVKNIPGNSRLQGSIKTDLFPEFMYHDPIANRVWMDLFELFPEYQATMLAEDQQTVMGFANSLPCYWEGPLENLPDRGWDWALEQGIADKRNGVKPNLLLGIQIALNSKVQSTGLSTAMLQEMITIARENGLSHIAIPVRPTYKSKYPLIPMGNYVKWTREDGLPFDPWLRVHVRNGGKILHVCHNAVYVPGTVAEWEAWTEMKFPESGDYVVEGALIPVKIDTEKDLGEYIEPNVWVVYEV